MIYSSYFEKELDLKTGVATGVGGRKNTIVYHSELENLILNVLGDKVSYNFTVHNTNLEDIVVVCNMFGASRSVCAIGEATPQTLNSSVEKTFPTTIAAHRAFDRAAIRFLGLGPRVYSNMEMEADGPKTIDPNNLVDVHQDEPQDVSDDAQNAQESANKDAATNNSGVDESCSNAKIEASETASNDAPNANATNKQPSPLDTLGAIVLTIGNRRGSTISQLFAELDEGSETAASWISFISESYNPRDPDKIKQVEAIKKYAELRNK